MQRSDPPEKLVQDLVASQGPALERFLASRLRGMLSEVPDLVQEVFLRFTRIDRLDSVRNPEAYLFGIARHVLYEHRSRTARAPKTIDIAEVASVLEDFNGCDPEAQLEVQQRIKSFDHALKRLPPNVYATLILNRVEGLTLKEVAVRLGVSRGMAKKYLAAALEECRT